MNARRKLRLEKLEYRRMYASVSGADFPSIDSSVLSNLHITVRYDSDVVGAGAVNNYLLKWASADGVLTAGDSEIQPDRVELKGRNADIFFSGSFTSDLYRLTVRDRITDLSGNQLDGDQDGVGGGDWITSQLITAGTQFDFDTSFGSNGAVRLDLGGRDFARITEQKDGKYFAEGVLQKNSTTNALLARLNKDGTLDTTFNGVGYVAADVGGVGFRGAVQVPDGGYAVAYVSSSEDYRSRFHLLKFRSDGSRDTGFGSNGAATVETDMELLGSLEVAPDGKLFVFGNRRVANEGNALAVMRLNPNGTIDGTFATQGVFTNPSRAPSYDQYASHLKVQSDSKILVLGSTFSNNSPWGPLGSLVLRLNSDGTLDTTFGSAGTVLVSPENVSRLSSANVNAVSVYPDGSFVVGSTLMYISGNLMGYSCDIAVSRFYADGKPDLRFGNKGHVIFDIGTHNDRINSMSLDANGQITIAAQRDIHGSDSTSRLLKLNSDGSLVKSFGSEGIFTVSAKNFAATTHSTYLREYLWGSFTSDGKYLMGGQLMYSSPTSPSWESDMVFARFDESSSTVNLSNNLGDTFTVAPDGWGTGQLQELSGASLGSLNRLTIGGVLLSSEPIAQRVLEDNGQTLTTASTTIAGLQVKRELTVPKSGPSSFLRTVETFNNSTSEPINTSVRISSTFMRDRHLRVFTTSDGDNLVEPTDQWIGFDDSNPVGGSKPIIQIFRSEFVNAPTGVYWSGDDSGWEYPITVQPGASTHVVTFTVTGNDRQQAIENANRLFTYGPENTALQFLTDEEIDSIANFKFNDAPTDLELSADTVSEDAPLGSVVGTLATVDRNLSDGDQFVYTLVAGEGSVDNSAFRIEGDHLLLAATLEYETKPSFAIRIRTTDRSGARLEETFVIHVTNRPGAPTDIHLSNSDVWASSPIGTAIGEFTTTGVESEEVVHYAFEPGEGDRDNSLFVIDDNVLQTATSDLKKGVYSIRLRATVQNGNWIEKTFSIQVFPGRHAPTDITLTNNVIEAVVIKSAHVGDFDTIDQDPDESFKYELVSGTGAEDNDKFTIDGRSLLIAQSFEYTETVFHIRVRSTDSTGLSVEKNFDVFFMPIVVDDTSETTNQNSVTLDVVANDQNEKDFSIQLVEPLQSSAGEFKLIDDQHIQFTPAAGFTGIGELQYQLVNAKGLRSNVGTVRVAVASSELQNPWNRTDVDKSGYVSPIDALLVINQLNSQSMNNEGVVNTTSRRFVDVNGDLQISPIDALLVINELIKDNFKAEGERFPSTDLAWAFDIEPNSKLRRKLD